MKTTKRKFTRLLAALTASFALFAFGERAEAQEIQLTGPLAGAPAVRKLKLYRQGRFEIAPSAAFTLLDEYNRTILFGARLTYNITDWLGIGAWGGYGAIQTTTALTDEIQRVNVERRQQAAMMGEVYEDTTTGRLTAVNLSNDFTKQIGEIQWLLAPQITLVPFRGKIALFQSLYIDTDLHLFLGPAFIGLNERKDCTSCTDPASFTRGTRMAIAPTIGAGLTFYVNKWNALGFDLRALPFSWNRGGFDTAGGGKDAEFPDNKVDSADQRFRLNMMLGVSWNFYLPTQFRISE